MSSDILWYIGGFLLVLTPIVIIHELGHFWAAKLTGVRVEEFGFGLPPRAIKAVSYTHLRAHETVLDLVCRLLLEKKKTK